MIVIMLEWQNRTQKTAQNSSKCYFHSSSPVASRLFLDLAYEGALCWLWASSSEYSFHIQPWFLLSGTELQNLNGIHNEMLGYFSAKRSNVQKISNWEISSMKAYRNLLTPVPFSFSNSYLLSLQQIFKHKSQPPSQAQMQTGVLQAQKNLKSN